MASQAEGSALAPMRAAQPGARGCWALNQDGASCGFSKLKDSDFCFIHDPLKQKARAESRTKAGRRSTARHSGPMPDVELSIKGAGVLLVYAIREVLHQPNTLQRAEALDRLVGRMITVVSAGGPKDPFAVAWRAYKENGALPEDDEMREAVLFHESTLRMMRQTTQSEGGPNDGARGDRVPGPHGADDGHNPRVRRATGSSMVDGDDPRRRLPP